MTLLHVCRKITISSQSHLIDCSYCEEEKYLVQTKTLFYVLLSFSSGNLYNTPPPPTDNTSLCKSGRNDLHLIVTLV